MAHTIVKHLLWMVTLQKEPWEYDQWMDVFPPVMLNEPDIEYRNIGYGNIITFLAFGWRLSNGLIGK